MVDNSVHMEYALKLAKKGLYTTLPNPRVGCVIIKNGHIVGEGWHQYAGDDHAEIVALRQAGKQAQGASVYVTLEPCTHWGKTPPCCDALIEAKVAKVIIAVQDPTEKVNGQGIEKLRQHGIEVLDNILADRARALNPGFFSLAEKQRPWIRIKSAMTLDGRTALESGVSSWISGKMSRADVQHWRAQSDVLLTGFGTVIADDPQLNVRLDATELDIPGNVRQPLRLVVDRRLRTIPQAKIYHQAGDVVVATCSDDTVAIDALGEQNVAVWQFKAIDQYVPLAELFMRLGREGFCEVQVEAGAGLVGALLEANLCDEMLLYIAPSLFGSGRPLAQMKRIDTMTQRQRFAWKDVVQIGDDLRVLLRKEDV